MASSAESHSDTLRTRRLTGARVATWISGHLLVGQFRYVRDSHVTLLHRDNKIPVHILQATGAPYLGHRTITTEAELIIRREGDYDGK